MWPKWMRIGSSKRNLMELVKIEGSLVGERQRGDRKVFIYLLKDFFVQVMFKGDDPVDDVEHLETFANLDQLNSHLEKEFKTAF
jgi:hypothetical protein